jgi:hypothetical protein
MIACDARRIADRQRQSLRGDARETQNLGLAARGIQALFVRRPQELTAIAICDDQTGFRRQKIMGKFQIDGESEGVAIIEIASPFPVGQKIRPAGFDFDDQEASGPIQRGNIGAPARAQSEFGDRGIAVIRQKPDSAPCDILRRSDQAAFLRAVSTRLIAEASSIFSTAANSRARRSSAAS